MDGHVMGGLLEAFHYLIIDAYVLWENPYSQECAHYAQSLFLNKS